MIAVDTNVIIRLLTKDNDAQYRAAHKLFSAENIFIADTVILEVEWVLRYAYEFEPEQICAAFRKLFGLKNVRLANAQIVAQAIGWHESGLDFADALHLAGSQQHTTLKTFDDKFIKRAKNLTPCTVEQP
ncbi:PilT-like protein [gamma proteobacterium HdN1]|nr:PilT-like protein [gamma proteobacterium HdN1]